MVVAWNYRLMLMGFLEKTQVGIRKHKDGKNILECPSKLLPNPGAFGYE